MFPWGIIVGMLGAIALDLPASRPQPRWRSPAAVTYSVDVAIPHGHVESDPLQRDRDFVARAAAAWAPALPMQVREATTEPADIEIHFVCPPDVHLRGREVGDCRTVFDPETGTFVQAECWIDEDLAGEALQHTICHELGHALGLKHCNDVRDVMFPECGLGGVTAHDLDAMRALYSKI